jgi:hypothetical protein
MYGLSNGEYCVNDELGDLCDLYCLTGIVKTVKSGRL